MAADVFTIVTQDGMWGVQVMEMASEFVTPGSVYPTKELAAARLLQLMHITTKVTPQAAPEAVDLETYSCKPTLNLTKTPVKKNLKNNDPKRIQNETGGRGNTRVLGGRSKPNPPKPKL